MSEAQKITVIGAGLMGTGIAQVFAAHDHPVSVYDPIESARASLPERMRASLKTLGLDEDIGDLVEVQDNLSKALSGAYACFEAAPEKLPLKQAIFADMETVAAPHTMLASNTSVIPITHIARKVKTSERVLGTHWWNPPTLIPLVEVVPTQMTKPHYVDEMIALLESVGKKPVHVKKDVPGFVGNRLQHALWREAQALIADGVCDAETVDTVVKNSFGMRLSVLGPIENADLIGLDLTLDIHNTILPELSTTKVPSPALVERIDQGHLGFKTGEGFLRWTQEDMQDLRTRLSHHLMDTQKTA